MMVLSSLRLGWLKETPSLYQLFMLLLWAEKMSSNNIVKLSGKDKESVKFAVKLLKQGGIIALPTDTIYGLAADATNSSAIASLYEAKCRDLNKPLAICVGNVSEVSKWGVTEVLPDSLLNDLLPGPVTVILDRRKTLNPDLNPGVKKVGIRVPGSNPTPFVRHIALALRRPLALTSANPSNEPSCIAVEEFKVLWSKLGTVFDGGVLNNTTRDGSTIVDLSEKGKYRITRPGVACKHTTHILHQYGLVEN